VAVAVELVIFLKLAALAVLAVGVVEAEVVPLSLHPAQVMVFLVQLT
jgi:hypothetical protein